MQHLWAKLNKQQGYIPPHGAEGLPPFYRCVSATVMESQLLRWELHSLPQSYLGRRPSELQMLSFPCLWASALKEDMEDFLCSIL